MITEKITRFIYTGALIFLLIGTFSSLQLHAQLDAGRIRAQPDRVPVLYDDITPTSVTSLMEVAPAEPLLVLQTKEIAEALALIENTRAWQQIREAPIWEIVWANVEMQSEVKESQQLIRPGLSIFSHLLGQETLLVVPKFQGIFDISPTLLIHIDRSDDLGEILAAGIEVGLANIPEVTKREYDGYGYQVTEPIGPGLRLSVGLIDDLLIASLGESTIKKVIDLHQGNSTESLANDAEFVKMMDRFRDNAPGGVTDFQSVFYADIATLYEFLKQMYPMAQEQVPQEMRPLADQAVNWLDLVQSITAAANITKDGLLSQSYVQLNPQATANNLLAMLQAPPITHDSVRFAPANIASYGASNLLNLPKVWEMAMGVIDTLPPEVNEQIHGAIDAVETQLGISVETDLLSWMGVEFAGISTGDYTVMPVEAAGDGDINAFPDFLLLVQTIDSGLATESLERLRSLTTMADAGIEWQTMDHWDTQIHTMEIPDVSVQPSYAVTDEYVLLSVTLETMKAALDCAAGRSANLATVAQFQELRAMTPEMVNSIGYANPSRSLTGLLDMVIGQISAGMDEKDRALFDPMLAQTTDLARAIVKTFVGQMQYTVKDGTGLRSYSFVKMQDLDEDFVLVDGPEAKLARSILIARGYEQNGMLNRAAPHLDRALEIDENHPEVLMMKIALLESEGNEKRADWFRRRLGLVPERAWHIIGPFGNPDGEGFDTSYPPEMGVDIEATYETEQGEVAWEKQQDDNPNDGFVNFGEMFDETEWKVAYAWTTVTAPEAGEVELRVGSDDDIKVWVNGIEALTHHVGRAAELDQDRVHVSLNQGVNLILVKVCNREYDWGFYLRFTDAARRPIKGLIYGE